MRTQRMMGTTRRRGQQEEKDEEQDEEQEERRGRWGGTRSTKSTIGGVRRRKRSMRRSCATCVEALGRRPAWPSPASCPCSTRSATSPEALPVVGEGVPGCPSGPPGRRFGARDAPGWPRGARAAREAHRLVIREAPGRHTSCAAAAPAPTPDLDGSSEAGSHGLRPELGEAPKSGNTWATRLALRSHSPCQRCHCQDTRLPDALVAMCRAVGAHKSVGAGAAS